MLSERNLRFSDFLLYRESIFFLFSIKRGYFELHVTHERHTSKPVIASSGKFSDRSSDSDVCFVVRVGDFVVASSVAIATSVVVVVAGVGCTWGNGDIGATGAAVTSADILQITVNHTTHTHTLLPLLLGWLCGGTVQRHVFKRTSTVFMLRSWDYAYPTIRFDRRGNVLLIFFKKKSCYAHCKFTRCCMLSEDRVEIENYKFCVCVDCGLWIESGSSRDATFWQYAPAGWHTFFQCKVWWY